MASNAYIYNSIREDYENVSKLVSDAVNIRYFLSKKYYEDKHEEVIGKITELCEKKDYLGILLFFDYLCMEGEYSRLNDKYIKIYNEICNEIQKKSCQGEMTDITNAQAFCLFMEVAYLHKHSKDTDIPEDTIDNLMSLMDGREESHGNQFLVSCLLRAEEGREAEIEKEEVKVSFEGMSLFFLRRDYAIKFIVLKWLTERQKVSNSLIVNKIIKLHHVFFAENVVSDNEYNIKFLMEYYSDLMRIISEGDKKWAHIILGSLIEYPGMYLCLKNNASDVLHKLIRTGADGQYLPVLIENEFNNIFDDFKDYILNPDANRLLSRSGKNWVNWIVFLKLINDDFKKSCNSNQDMVNEVIGKIGELNSQCPISFGRYNSKQRFLLGQNVCCLMYYYIEAEGDINTLIDTLGSNNPLLLEYDYRLRKQLKSYVNENFVKNNHNPGRIKKVINDKIRGKSDKEKVSVYLNSIIRYFYDICDFCKNNEITSTSDFDEYRIIVEIADINPKENSRDLFELRADDLYMLNNRKLRFDKEWLDDNYYYLWTESQKNQPLTVEVNICAIDKNSITVRGGIIPHKAKVDWNNKAHYCFEWLQDIIESGHVYDPFDFFVRNGDRIYKKEHRDECKIDEKKIPFLYIDRAQNNEQAARLALAMFNVMLGFVDNREELREFLYLLKRTRLCRFNDCLYVTDIVEDNIDTAKKYIVDNKILKREALKDFSRLVPEGRRDYSLEEIQNIVNIYMNSYIKQYVGIAALYDRLQSCAPDVMESEEINRDILYNEISVGLAIKVEFDEQINTNENHPRGIRYLVADDAMCVENDYMYLFAYLGRREADDNDKQFIYFYNNHEGKQYIFKQNKTEETYAGIKSVDNKNKIVYLVDFLYTKGRLMRYEKISRCVENIKRFPKEYEAELAELRNLIFSENVFKTRGESLKREESIDYTKAYIYQTVLIEIIIHIVTHNDYSFDVILRILEIINRKKNTCPFFEDIFFKDDKKNEFRSKYSELVRNTLMEVCNRNPDRDEYDFDTMRNAYYSFFRQLIDKDVIIQILSNEIYSESFIRDNFFYE